MKIEIHYPDNRVETHKGIKYIQSDRGGVVFSKGKNAKSKRYRSSIFSYYYFVIMEEETDGGSKNKD